MSAKDALIPTSPRKRGEVNRPCNVTYTPQPIRFQTRRRTLAVS